MKLIKIGAIWCSGCLVMNKVISKALKNYTIEYQEYDLDMDEEEAKKYHPGDTLPVFIIMDNGKETNRFCGELSYEDFIKKLREGGVIDEENN